MDIILIGFFSYLSGSIPFGLILTKVFGKIDVRNIGSGNIGATNVLRTGNKFLALMTLLLDIAKGYIPVMLTLIYFPQLAGISALAAFLGHIFSICLKFKGGKGIATYLGILFALSLQLSILFIFTWLVVSLIFKYSSLSSMFASLTVLVVNLLRDIAYPILSIMSDQNLNDKTYAIDKTFLLFVFFILIIFTHRKNISNLKNKTEQKIKI